MLIMNMLLMYNYKTITVQCENAKHSKNFKFLKPKVLILL